MDFDRQLAASRSRSSSARGHAAEPLSRRAQMEADTVRVRYEAQVSALQAELHAAKVQLEVKTSLVNDQSAAVRDLELRYASKHREAKELAASVEVLEQQVCRDKAEINNLRQDTVGGGARAVRTDERARGGWWRLGRTGGPTCACCG